jgi:hypothetical protein
MFSVEEEAKQETCRRRHHAQVADFMHGLCFNLEDGGDTFL